MKKNILTPVLVLALSSQSAMAQVDYLSNLGFDATGVCNIAIDNARINLHQFETPYAGEISMMSAANLRAIEAFKKSLQESGNPHAMHRLSESFVQLSQLQLAIQGRAAELAALIREQTDAMTELVTQVADQNAPHRARIASEQASLELATQQLPSIQQDLTMAQEQEALLAEQITAIETRIAEINAIRAGRRTAAQRRELREKTTTLATLRTRIAPLQERIRVVNADAERVQAAVERIQGAIDAAQAQIEQNEARVAELRVQQASARTALEERLQQLQQLAQPLVRSHAERLRGPHDALAAVSRAECSNQELVNALYVPRYGNSQQRPSQAQYDAVRNQIINSCQGLTTNNWSDLSGTVTVCRGFNVVGGVAPVAPGITVARYEVCNSFSVVTGDTTSEPEIKWYNSAGVELNLMERLIQSEVCVNQYRQSLQSASASRVSDQQRFEETIRIVDQMLITPPVAQSESAEEATAEPQAESAE